MSTTIERNTVSAQPSGDLLAAKTYSQLEQEIADLHRHVSDLELRLTGSAVRSAEKDRRVWAAATSAAHDQLRYRADQYWTLALADTKQPLDRLIHRAKTLGERPKRDKITALADAARAAEDAIARGRKAAGDAQQPLREMTADRDRLREHILERGRALHRRLGRPCDSDAGTSCDCAGCDLIVDMDAPRPEEQQSSDGDQVLPDGSVQPVLPGF